MAKRLAFDRWLWLSRQRPPDRERTSSLPDGDLGGGRATLSHPAGGRPPQSRRLRRGREFALSPVTGSGEPPSSRGCGEAPGPRGLSYDSVFLAVSWRLPSILHRSLGRLPCHQLPSQGTFSHDRVLHRSQQAGAPPSKSGTTLFRKVLRQVMVCNLLHIPLITSQSQATAPVKEKGLHRTWVVDATLESVGQSLSSGLHI